MSQTNKLPFLLEIGSEEIPARFIPSAMKFLEKAVAEQLEKNFLTWEDLKVMATPRRMALLIQGLSDRQPDRQVEIKGPPVSVAFDQDGHPTRAAEGFARKVGVALDQCGRGHDQRGEFLLVQRTEAGRSASEVLAEFLPSLIMEVPFRKTMRWAAHDLEYARPLQWLVALLGTEVVPLKVDYLRAGRETRGHRTLSGDKKIELASPAEYQEALLAVGVMVDDQHRRQAIVDGLNLLLAEEEAGSQLLADEDLLQEVVFLCEYPTPFLGSFSEEFLELPAEVVTTAMKTHQRYFSVIGSEETGLRPRFAAVRCGGQEHLTKVVAGNERVLRARLADALFYWEFDQKKTPDQRVEMLGSVTWLEGFGTVLDKTRRVDRLAGWLWNHGLGQGQGGETALSRAAYLSKSDLVSEMIKDGKEFTKLEGFIGACYARLAGEEDAVCRAIEEHYLPRSSGGPLPSDGIGATLSVADRLDTVAGCWLAGFVPTGAKDPYALRRHVLAILRILLDQEAHLDLEHALEFGLEQVLPYAPREAGAGVLAAIIEFVKTRMAGFFVDVLGQDPEVTRAVIPVRWSDPVDALQWVQALSGFRGRDDFQLLATGFKRCRNILKGEELPVETYDQCLTRWQNGGSGATGEDFSQLPEPVEQELREKVARAAKKLSTAEKCQDYNEVFDLLSSLGPAIDGFFEEVRVNAEQEDLRRLRHTFLREIHGLFARYADFTAVEQSD